MKYLMIVALCACAGCNSPTGPSPEESRLRVENMRLQAERDALLIVVDTINKAR